ncbi:MAG TPA: hypothetical protein VEZ40_19300, partial [Pyrinomonadaceae bacterium]|nr:hypothetical protein [Pyrinomonadaceae bacterium]
GEVPQVVELLRLNEVLDLILCSFHPLAMEREEWQTVTPPRRGQARHFRLYHARAKRRNQYTLTRAARAANPILLPARCYNAPDDNQRTTVYLDGFLRAATPPCARCATTCASARIKE